MYNKQRVRSTRSKGKNGWSKKSRNNSRSKPGRGVRRGGFSGQTINATRFINKAEQTSQVKIVPSKHSFDDLAIHRLLKASIASRGFNSPMPIQEKIIPFILKGRDVIGLANTGTGKTGAFLIPMIHKAITNREERVLIIVPTRELAIQIQEEFCLFAKKINVSSVVVVGGANIQRQIKALKSSPNVVVGTPGRLKDLISRKSLNLSQFNNVVLDEADRMLDMGFINDVKTLLSFVAKKRQTMLFSATFSKEIEKLVSQFLVNPERISIKTGETSKHVNQDIVKIGAGDDKKEVLHNLLIQTEFEKVLVFTRTKHGADKLSKNLLKRGFKSDAIHGNKTHNRRQKALKMFKENAIDILIATDVAARGLDIPDVSHVINFDVPATYDDYVHRIGRTGRADKLGTALTFID